MPSVEHAYAEKATVEIPRFGIWAHTLQHAGSYANPYREVSATAQLTAPGGTSVRRLPLFWDGGATWRLRFLPDVIGTWQWHTRSSDSGLDGASGTFEVVPSDRKGSLRSMSGYPHHFERQDGSRTWFLGEAAWSLYVDNVEQQHDRAAAEHHLDVRAAQGFDVVHSMLMSELGWGNAGGVPSGDMAAERINPSYWQEVDRRLPTSTARASSAGWSWHGGASSGTTRNRSPGIASPTWRQRHAMRAMSRHAIAPTMSIGSPRANGMPALFGATAWWRLQPRDDLARCPVGRGNDRTFDGLPAPPLSAYWCLAEPGEQYVLYVRGLTVPVQLSLDTAAATYVVRQFSPRSGAFEHLGMGKEISAFTYRPPDESDWVVLLQRT